MNTIVTYAILILSMLFVLKLFLTFIFDRLYLRADKKELKISLILILLLEFLSIVSAVLNLTDKNYLLLAFTFGLMIVMFIASIVFNFLFISKYLIVDSFIKILMIIFSSFILDKTVLFNLYLSNIILSPISNTNGVNYSFVMITMLVVFITSIIINIKTYKRTKNI